MNEVKKSNNKKTGFVVDCSDYVIFTASSILYILNVISNCYVSYCMYNEGQMEWFATSISLLVIFSLFTQTFSHIFFTYNNIADKACSIYLQHINSKSDEDVSDPVTKKSEYLEIHHQAVCPHSGYPDRLWTEKNLVDLKSEPKVNACQKICSQGVSVVLHMLHIGPVIRYICLLKFRSKEKGKKQDDEELEEKKIKDIQNYFCKLCLLERAADYSLRDITLLRLFEALEAAPQVLLQLYLIFYMQVFTYNLLAPAILGTLQVSFCLALSIKYQRMPRRESYDQTTVGLLCVTLYKVFLVSYRMLCLAVFASLYRGYLILLLFTHSLIMLLWILYLDSSFSSSNHEEIAFNFTVAMLKAFTFVNVSPGRSRNRVVLYHVCLNVENVVIGTVWYYKTVHEIEYGLIAIVSMGALYLVGILIKTLYYTCCHPTKLQKQGPLKQEMSVLYKNKGGPVMNNPIKDNSHLLKHDENNDVIHFPPNNTNTGSTWMLGFIEQNPDSIGGGGSRRMLITPQSYMHSVRSRCGYDTYHSVPGKDSCSGYDSEVASIMSSKTPIYENLVPSSKNRMHNSIPLQHPISSLQHPISSMQHPLVHHPISSVQHPITTIPHHMSGVQHPISNIQHPISSLHQHSILHHNNPILTNPMVWQPQQLNPPSGRNSADRQYNNNDSLSSSGVYSEEERKLNLKARLESEYDNLEEPNSDSTRAPPEASLSPDSDNGDIYENLPTVIKQGQQVHSDGLTMQSINIQGPKARFDGSFDGSSAPNQSWDMLQGSLNFAYGPPTSQEKEKDPKEDTSDYTSLKELAPAKPVHPVVPARTVSTVKNSGSQHSLASASQLTDANRFQTDV
ncbi:uncharacterized protein LOC134826129 isoform X2 [Bolinopsis microptera]|uniref:uncharacterized protein LOC134826129 isoform X2 n=1 Tax=Bolinopsis microptera TaxID=2820187 RepID=UPI003078E018